MRKNIVLPFRVIRSGSSAVIAGNWYRRNDLGTESEWLENGSGFLDWSYDTPLLLGREIVFNSEKMLDELDLVDSDPEFELVHSIKISVLGARKTLHRNSFRPGDSEKLDFVAILDSSELCEEITLISTLILKSNLSNVPDWAPSKKGSTCWSDETKVILEGSGSRFPMQDTPFSQHPTLPNHASWHLDWRPGLLHYSFNSAVTLYLNSEKSEFFDRVKDGDEILLEQIMSGITGEICSYLLDQEDFINTDVEYPDGSLGSVARVWLHQALPSMTLLDIRNTYIRSPNTIHTALRSLTAVI
jgi:hypothetical protein